MGKLLSIVETNHSHLPGALIIGSMVLELEENNEFGRQGSLESRVGDEIQMALGGVASAHDVLTFCVGHSIACSPVVAVNVSKALIGRNIGSIGQNNGKQL